MLERLALLDEAECRSVTDEVQRLRRYWTPRHDFLPSFTLGAAAYLDVPRHGVSTYVVRSVRSNRFLKRDFAWLHSRTTEALAKLLDAPVGISPRFAAPGFHIFEHHERLGELQARQHFDLQAARLDFDPADAQDPAKRFSFTMVVDMPAAGAGLYVWPIEHAETFDKAEAELLQMCIDRPPTYQGYGLGELLVHDGSHLHQIAADRAMKPGEGRVTYQGHGLLTGGSWQLYW